MAQTSHDEVSERLPQLEAKQQQQCLSMAEEIKNLSEREAKSEREGVRSGDGSPSQTSAQLT